MVRPFLSVAVSALLLSGAVPVSVQSALHSITAAKLKGDLSFLASDALQGRFTPSPGLDIAAEFIAAQFREAGLQPGGNQDYFQTASMVDRHPPKVESDLLIQSGSKTHKIASSSITVVDTNRAIDVQGAHVVVFNARDVALLKGVELTGKALIVPRPDFNKAVDANSLLRKMREFDKAVASSEAAIEVVVSARKAPQMNRLISEGEASEKHVPMISVVDGELQSWIQKTTGGDAEPRTLSIQIGAPEDQKAVLKNVIGILRGSDPVLKNTCVLLTAHYDHIGTLETGSGYAMNNPNPGADRIYNGANDDGSGTVSVVEIAKALAKLTPHPKRSIVFMTFFGEERGDIGSTYYGNHPVFPIANTVADVNLEQLGRTDSTVGKQLLNASVTGYDYSTVTKFLEDAGRETGIKLYLDKEASDAYFTRSDNDALAEQGVPAHTLTVAFDYPDYHGLGDEWQKIDYENMAHVDRMVALALVRIANSAKAPEWNAQNPKTAPFREAQAKQRQH